MTALKENGIMNVFDPVNVYDYNSEHVLAVHYPPSAFLRIKLNDKYELIQFPEKIPIRF